MKTLSSNGNNISHNDDILYERIIRCLKEVKLVRGGTELAYTLRNHPKIRNYCKDKQKAELDYIDNHFFNEDGSLKKESLQVRKINVN